MTSSAPTSSDESGSQDREQTLQSVEANASLDIASYPKHRDPEFGHWQEV